jgi:hypothetical protein
MFLVLAVLGVSATIHGAIYGTVKIAKSLTGYVRAKKHATAEPPTDLELEMPDDLQNQVLPLQEIPRLAKKIAALARAELYLTHRSKDQVIQVREWSFRTMVSMNVRKVDISKVLPFVERLAFLESRYEREARLMTLSTDYLQRERQTNTRLFTYEGPSLTHPLGRLEREPAVSDR